MASIKLDENVPDLVRSLLQQYGHDVALARDQDLAGVDDDRLLAVVSHEGRALLTLDRDFSNILRHPPQTTAGIIVIRLQKQTLVRVQSAAETVGTLLATSKVSGELWIVDESRVRMWPR